MPHLSLSGANGRLRGSHIRFLLLRFEPREHLAHADPRADVDIALADAPAHPKRKVAANPRSDLAGDNERWGALREGDDLGLHADRGFPGTRRRRPAGREKQQSDAA